MTTTPRPVDGASGAPAIELRSLIKSFPSRRGSQDAEVRAVDGIDLRIEPGEVVAFLGPNGAGKTTTLDMVLGLTEPTSGTAEVFGRRPREAVVGGHVSAVLQTGGLLRDLTVRETVRMIASTYAVHSPVDEVIDRAGLRSLADRRVSKCSGGEQQRLRFALALLPDPRLLVLDEPTAGMDVTARRDFWDTMHADASAGRTVVFATHYLEEADAFADRIVLIAGGRIVADGTTAEIRSQASGRTVSATLPPGSVAESVARLRTVGGVHQVEERGNRVVVTAGDSDTVARLLLLELGGTDLEIVTAGLEQAFMTLTGDGRDARDARDTGDARDARDATTPDEELVR
ncbi:multidrug ABC transporter ATP-binding protein [Terrabacter sp. Soil811]|uniref:ABC transporter ATP-binding protein n=1 Tax=Terrabacter sp. Soil811 TaxID=1736419 RepID=UPI0006FC6787|nr:ABC transporter ATP-binding protein [Terrabacter sp. Soil811]KRF40036.1 multidrug ABC transporter ATP-binding protein [Terrabacter sp. Soil811]